MKSLRYCARLLLAAAITMTSFVVPGGVLADGSNISISPATLEVENGASFTVDVLIDTDTAIRGWQMDVAFDPSTVQCTGVTIGGFIQTWATAHGASVLPMPYDIDNGQGTITGICAALLGANGSGPDGAGILCTIAFTAQPDVDDFCDITPISVGLADIDAEPIPGVTATSCVVAIGDAEERASPPPPEDEEEPRALTMEEETRLAVDAAGYWLDRRASDTFPEFSGAELSAPQSCYDLEDRLICFRFSVEKDVKTVGTMTIGSSLYGNAPFEVSTGKLPELPSPSEVTVIAERDLEIIARSTVSEQPEKLLYLGLYDIYAVYEVDGQDVAVNLMSKCGRHFFDLQSSITTPEKYAAAREERSKDGERDYTHREVLDVPLRDMNDGEIYWEYKNNNNCGPTSGAMIMGYYKACGFQLFPDWAEDHDRLYEDMECNQPVGVPPEPFGRPGQGWVEAAEHFGYPDFYTWYDSVMTDDSWDDTIVPCIDDNVPMMIYFGSETPQGEVSRMHWNALKGYAIEDNYRFVITNDPQADPYNWEHELDWDVHYPYTNLTVIKLGSPTVGIELVETSTLNVILSWLGGLPERLTSILPGFSNDGPQANR